MKTSFFMNKTLQLLGIAAILVLFFFLFVRQHQGFEPIEKKPKIIQRADLENTDKKVDAVTQIRTGLYIKDFSDFNVARNKFSINVIVWFDLDPSQVPLKKVEEFSFAKGQILEKSKCEHRKNGDRLFVKYDCLVQFSGALDHHAFPMDDHRIFMTLTNECLDGRKFQFDVTEDDFHFSSGTPATGWVILNKSVLSGVRKWVLNENDESKALFYPSVAFAIDVDRTGANKHVAIFLPLFILLFLCLFSLTIKMSKANMPSILLLCAMSISALIFFRLTIEQLTPDTSHLTLSDEFYALSLMLMFLITILQIYLYHFLKRSKLANTDQLYNWLDSVRSILYWIFLGIIVIATYWLFP